MPNQFSRQGEMLTTTKTGLVDSFYMAVPHKHDGRLHRLSNAEAIR